MLVQTQNNQTVITIPDSIKFSYLQDFIDYLTVKSIVSKSKATDKEVDDLSEKAQEDWWAKNKSKFIK